MKTIITGMLKELTDSNMNRYIPSKTRIKLPEIPGSIMAQMAMAPEIKIKGIEVLASAGEITVIKYAITTPATTAMIVVTVHSLIAFDTYMAEATIRPKKKDHTRMG